ncbi:MAG: glucose 1-dehydrogenase [Actinomycetia bacterium]|nr:glucose 1-dehydrogenase [Actinomycetes bacterium]MCP4962210.1 glucose 1-dehydrogenase [Actinomycetes bacterium]
MAEQTLEGKVILITGGGRGQGESEARMCRAAGAEVVITDVLVDEGRQLAGEIGATFLEQDVVDEGRWDQVIGEIMAEHGRIDGLVNNAGVFLVKAMTDTTLDEYRRVTEINQTSIFLGMKAVAGPMSERGSGSIVNISSIAGLGGAGGSAFAYTASKWAVRGMTKAAAVELGPSGVRVNSVHPGIIETQMLEHFVALGDDWHSRLRGAIPLGRTAAPGEVANMVLFLLSEQSSYCSGHEFVVDGAMRA